MPEIGPADGDLVLGRYHGLGPMGGTDLDAVCRNLGATTIIGVGVSVNVGMLNFAMDAVNAGYQFVMPRRLCVRRADRIRRRSDRQHDLADRDRRTER